MRPEAPGVQAKDFCHYHEMQTREWAGSSLPGWSWEQGCPGNTGAVFPGRYFPVFPALSNTPPGNTGKYFLLQLFYHFSSKS